VHPEIDLELVRGLADFRQALRTFLAASETLSKAAGVTAVQYQAMLAICAWQGPMAVRDLADRLVLTHSAAVQMVHRLSAAGLVRRESSQQDRRVVRVGLTPEGGRLLARLSRLHRDELLRPAEDLKTALHRLGRTSAQSQAEERQGSSPG
jgi:DNA-binding MarR family transcriptional regulator